MQGPITQWVTDHRKHHASRTSQATRTRRTSDTARASGAPFAASSTRTSAGSSRASAWSRAANTARTSTRTGWCGRSTARTCSGSPHARDPVRDRLPVGGTAAAGLEALVWGGLIRIFLYQHATFSVNSICHMFGRQDFRSRDEARNNWLVALPRLRGGLAQQPPRVSRPRHGTASTGGRSTCRGG